MLRQTGQSNHLLLTSVNRKTESLLQVNFDGMGVNLLGHAFKRLENEGVRVPFIGGMLGPFDLLPTVGCKLGEEGIPLDLSLDDRQIHAVDQVFFKSAAVDLGAARDEKFTFIEIIPRYPQAFPDRYTERIRVGGRRFHGPAEQNDPAACEPSTFQRVERSAAHEQSVPHCELPEAG